MEVSHMSMTDQQRAHVSELTAGLMHRLLDLSVLRFEADSLSTTRVVHRLRKEKTP